MCGLFAFVATGDRGPHRRILERIAAATEARGRHAFGFAWLDSRRRLRSYRQTGRISNHLDMLRMASDARLLIGHCRYATEGDPLDNINNHPHPCDGGWIAHNGRIPNWQEWMASRGLAGSSKCDSEALALAIEDGDGSMLERVQAAADLARERPFAIMGIWKSPARIIVHRRGNPLHIGDDREGYYLASLPRDLPNAEAFDDDASVVAKLGGELEWHRQPVADSLIFKFD